MTDVQPEDVEAYEELKNDGNEYVANRTFDCGCYVSVVKDDSQGNDYPGNPSILFDYGRCAVHSMTVKDPGPVQEWMDEYSKAHPMKVQEVKPFTDAENMKLGLTKKVPVGCGRGNHDYRIVLGKQYAKCFKCTSTRTVGNSKVQRE